MRKKIKCDNMKRKYHKNRKKKTIRNKQLSKRKENKVVQQS